MLIRMKIILFEKNREKNIIYINITCTYIIVYYTYRSLFCISIKIYKIYYIKSYSHSEKYSIH